MHRRRRRNQQMLGGGGGLAYLLSQLGLVALWPMYEPSGTNVKNLSSISGLDGTHNANVAVANALYLDGLPAPYWNGTSANTEIYSANLGSNFSAAEGTHWQRCKFDGNWADATFYVATQIGTDINNRFLVHKPGSANTWRIFFTAGGSAVQRDQTTSTTNWFSTAITWNKAQNRIRVYFDGVQVGADMTYTGTWAGALTTAWTDIGGPSSLWYKGWIRNDALYNLEWTPTQVADAHARAA